MSADRSSVNLQQLFNDLSRFEQSSDYEKALKVANKIIKEDANNAKAIHCKIVCLIHSSAFEEALKEIAKCDNNLAASLLFEKAYCLYRLNDINEALNILDSIKEDDLRVAELRAQALYRLERFNECYQQYVDIIRNSDDDYGDERETNLAAVLAGLSIENESVADNQELGEQTFELCYNKACILLGQNKYDEALDKLNGAENMCRKTLEEEGASEEEIEAELAIIRAQIAYCYQMQKKDETAIRMYNQILKQKPSDSALLAVTCNNVVTINKDQNVFDSKKKMKTALTENIEFKLSSSQRKSILFNNCLLLMHTNQSDSCRKQLNELKSKFPNASLETVLLEVALLCKEKKLNEAIKYLKSVCKENKSEAVPEVVLLLAQILLRQGEVKQTCEVLESTGGLALKPGIVSTLVTLYLSLDDKQSAANVLSKCVTWYEKNEPSGENLSVLYRQNARFLMEIGKAREAAAILERLLSRTPQNPKIVSLLISAYSQFDPQKAQEISKRLPSIESLIESTDVELLETSNWSLGAKYVKKIVKSDITPTGVTTDKEKKKRKKKKKQLPKSYDPNVDPDPERWLPRYQRSTFKKKKDKRGAQAVGKGTQGSVAEIEIKPNPRVPSNANAGPSNSPQGPRQQRPTQKKKKKTSKK